MSKTKILVVEDEAIVAEDITKTLKDLGYAVPSVVASGNRVIEQVKADQPDLVLMDILLKGEMDGVQAADIIRQRFKIPVVYLTSHADTMTLDRAKDTDPFGYLLKPFGDRELQSTIEMALHKSEMEHRIEHLNAVLKALRTVDQFIVREKDKRKLLQGICHSLTESLSYHEVWTILVDDEKTPIDCIYSGMDHSVNDMDHFITCSKLPPCTQKALLDSQVVIVDDNSLCKDCSLHRKDHNLQTLVSRLESDNHIYGILFAEIPWGVHIDEEEVSLFSEISKDIGYALHNIAIETEREKAVKEISQRNRELATINTIATTATQFLDLHEVLQTSLKETVSILGAEGGVLYLYDEKKKFFTPFTRHGISNDIIKEVSGFTWGEGLSGYVAKTQEPILIEDLAKEKKNISPAAVKEGWHSFMSAPIISGTSVSAVITLLSHENDYFRKDHLNLILHICNQIGIAIHNVTLYKGIQQELKDRIRAEEELKREKAFSESIIETANALIVGIDTDGKIIFFNKAAEKITGYTKEEVLGKDWFTRFVPSYAKNIVYEYLKGEKETLPIHNENPIHTKSGQKRVITWNNTLLKDVHGDVSGIIGIGEDITEMRRTQRILRILNRASQSIQKISTKEEIITLLGKHMMEFGMDTIITQITEDEKSMNIVFSSDDESLSPILAELEYDRNPPEIPLADFKKIKELIKKKRGVYIEDVQEYIHSQIKKKDITKVLGMIEWKKMIVVPLFIRDRVWGLLFVGSSMLSNTDLSAFTAFAQQASTALENAQLYEKLRQAHAELSDLTENLELKVQERTEELMRANQLKSDFLASMSHEFRTPLNSIMSFAEILLMQLEGPINKQQEEDLELIKESGKELLTLVNNILDLSKIETGKLELHIEPVDPSDIVSAVASQLTLEAIENGLTMHTQICGALPLMMGDEIRLKQVLRNLISNALKFTKKGGIVVGASHDEDTVTFWVKDTGIGISEEDRALIFEKFRQAQGGNSREFGGTGLGLSLSKELVELHGGKIWLESEKGKGSTFYFTIPTKK
jgi:PAS domain S-box-containing protein